MDSAKNDPKHDIANDYKPLNDNIFNVSWARRKGHGILYGSNYIDKYKSEQNNLLVHSFRMTSIITRKKQVLKAMADAGSLAAIYLSLKNT